VHANFVECRNALTVYYAGHINWSRSALGPSPINGDQSEHYSGGPKQWSRRAIPNWAGSRASAEKYPHNQSWLTRTRLRYWQNADNRWSIVIIAWHRLSAGTICVYHLINFQLSRYIGYLFNKSFLSYLGLTVRHCAMLSPAAIISSADIHLFWFLMQHINCLCLCMVCYSLLSIFRVFPF